jgi:hypothetical protein
MHLKNGLVNDIVHVKKEIDMQSQQILYNFENVHEVVL